MQNYIIVNNIQYSSFADFCNQKSIDYKQSLYKLALGFDLSELPEGSSLKVRKNVWEYKHYYVIRYPRPKKLEPEFHYYDEDFVPESDSCVDDKVNDQAISEVADATQQTPPQKIEIIHNSLKLTFETLTEASRHFGVSASTVRGRIKRGWDVDKALIGNEDTVSSGDSQPIKVSVSGKVLEFMSQNEACRHFNVAGSTFRGRIKKGKSIEEALGLQ